MMDRDIVPGMSRADYALHGENDCLATEEYVRRVHLWAPQGPGLASNMPGVPYTYDASAPNTVERLAEINFLLGHFAEAQRFELNMIITAGALAGGWWIAVSAIGRGQK